VLSSPQITAHCWTSFGAPGPVARPLRLLGRVSARRRLKSRPPAPSMERPSSKPSMTPTTHAAVSTVLNRHRCLRRLPGGCRQDPRSGRRSPTGSLARGGSNGASSTKTVAATRSCLHRREQYALPLLILPIGGLPTPPSKRSAAGDVRDTAPLWGESLGRVPCVAPAEAEGAVHIRKSSRNSDAGSTPVMIR
jgi:hypothetical protein